MTVVAKRFQVVREDNGDENTDETDALVEVECGGEYVDLHVSPRTEDVVTISLLPGEAWGLARELARAATEAEQS